MIFKIPKRKYKKLTRSLKTDRFLSKYLVRYTGLVPRYNSRRRQILSPCMGLLTAAMHGWWQSPHVSWPQWPWLHHMRKMFPMWGLDETALCNAVKISVRTLSFPRSHSPQSFLFGSSYGFLACVQCQLFKGKVCVRFPFVPSAFPSVVNVLWLFVEWLYGWVITCKLPFNIFTVPGSDYKIWCLILADMDVWSEYSNMLNHRSDIMNIAGNNVGRP